MRSVLATCPALPPLPRRRSAWVPCWAPRRPLIAIGSGLGVLAIHLLKRDAPATGYAVIGAAGSFAAISTMFGSPLPARFS